MKTLDLSNYGNQPAESSWDIANEQRRTVRRIIWGKCLDALEDATLRGILANSALTVGAVGLSAALIFPHEAAEIAKTVIQWQNYAIPKVAGSFAFVFNVQSFVHAFRNMIPEPQEVPSGDTIEGIPTVELLDHLFEFESFKRDDIEKKFGIPRNRFTDLASKLESLKVLVRGENNARILNPEFSRSDVASILGGAERATELKPMFRRVNENTWANSPSKKEIVQRVKNWFSTEKKEDTSAVSPSHGFTVRKIGESRELAAASLATDVQVACE